MFKKIIAALLIMVFLLSGIVLADSNYGTAVIDARTSDRVHLREKADVKSKSKGLYFTGTIVTCESDTNKTWVKVTIGSETGYMKAEYLRKNGNVKSRQPIGYVQDANGVILRTRPSSSARTVSILPRGSAVTIQGETSERWYYVSAGTRTGYVFHDEISANLNLPKSMKYLDVMLNRQQVTYAETGTKLYLNQLGLDNSIFQYESFTALDLDRDNATEIVLTIRGGLGSIILDSKNSNITAYLVYYRAMNELKADGTFSYSNGAADSGFARISFKNGKSSFKPFTYLQNGVPYVNGKKTNQSSFDSAVQKQAKKAEPAWFIYNAENVQIILNK